MSHETAARQRRSFSLSGHQAPASTNVAEAAATSFSICSRPSRQYAHRRTNERRICHCVAILDGEAMANNEILQIVLLALVAGVAVVRMGAAGEPLLTLAESVSLLMLHMTG